MKVVVLICFIFLMLEDGNTCYIDGRIPTYTEEVGKNITVECSVFRYGGSNKLFCKEICEEGNVLIETTDTSAQRGRYSIEHRNHMYYVSITQLKKSDSGRYRCLLRPSSISAPYYDFEIVVTEAPTIFPSSPITLTPQNSSVNSDGPTENNQAMPFPERMEEQDDKSLEEEDTDKEKEPQPI